MIENVGENVKIKSRLVKNVADFKFWQRSTASKCLKCIMASPLPYGALYCCIWRWLLWSHPFHAGTPYLICSTAGPSAIRSRLMSWRKSVNPLYSCLSTLPVICVPHFHMGSAWQPQIHTLPLPTTGLGPERRGLCCERLYGWMCGIGHQPDVWVAPASLPLP